MIVGSSHGYRFARLQALGDNMTLQVTQIRYISDNLSNDLEQPHSHASLGCSIFG